MLYFTPVYEQGLGYFSLRVRFSLFQISMRAWFSSDQISVGCLLVASICIAISATHCNTLQHTATCADLRALPSCSHVEEECGYVCVCVCVRSNVCVCVLMVQFCVCFHGVYMCVF